MRRFQLRLEQYDTDKIASGYLERYDPILEPWLEKPIVLLELGIHKGGSLRLWRDYLRRATIVGIDTTLPHGFESAERIHVFEGSQGDTGFLSRVANELAPDGFDIIIDDASHFGELSKIAFWHLFENHLKPRGLYVIEDWGTGYWDDWPDGKSLDLQTYHSSTDADSGDRNSPGSGDPGPTAKKAWLCHAHGMVGFVKQLVDEQGASDVTRSKLIGRPARASKFESLLFVPAIVFVRKA
jgi:hypothetical protein